MSEYSDLLYARPSFLEGMARAFDLGATLQEYNQSSTPEQADALALHSDWECQPFLRAASDALLSGTPGSPVIDDAGQLVGIVSWAGGKVGTPGLQGMVPRPHVALPGWVWRRIQGAMSHPSA